MALTKCWECGETVSEHAETCPHCGVKSPGWKPDSEAEDARGGESVSEPQQDSPEKRSGCGRFIIWMAVLVIVLVVIGLMVNELQDAGVLPTPIPRSTSTSTPTPDPTPTWEEWKELAEEISYDNLFRYAERHTGKWVYYRGKVIQVVESQGDFQLRVNVTSGEYGFWDDTVFLRFSDAPVRILEDDVVSFVGIMNGVITYESVGAGEITIPDITVLELIIEGE